MQLPPWEEDNVTRDKSQPIEVQVSGGSTYAEVQFGYARFGAPGQFFCTARAEACNTSSLPTSPYNFESETRALQPCPNGCKIKIPAVAGNLMYMRIRKTMDGVTWVNGNIEAIPLP